MKYNSQSEKEFSKKCPQVRRSFLPPLLEMADDNVWILELPDDSAKQAQNGDSIFTCPSFHISNHYE